MQDHPEDILLQRLNQCPLFSACFGPSLRERINTCHWFENRFIQAILRDTGWMEQHERLLAEADIREVNNCCTIFSDLDGGDPDYDLKIFDVLAEVRLVRWARENGYTDIEKLIPGEGPTPDFRMRKEGKIIIAEAKHFRERDFLPEFVDDRLRGLAWKTGCLTEFGVVVRYTDKYARERQCLLKTRKDQELHRRQDIREELTEEWLHALKDRLTHDPGRDSEIVNGLFVVSRSGIRQDAGVEFSGPHKTEREATELMLEKLCGNLMKALEQIRSLIGRNPSAEIPSRAVVFLAGTSSWSMEWDAMWKALCDHGDSTIWHKVNEIHCIASELVKLPFELVVAKHNEGVLEYAPFPWTRNR